MTLVDTVIEIGLATDRDLDDILALQKANQITNGGMLSVSFSRSQIATMMCAMPLVVARRDNRVVGFLLCSTIEQNSNVPILHAMLQVYPLHAKNAYVYGPICVDASERGKGLAQAMFAELQLKQPGREGILFIRRDNAASLKSHHKMGMREVAQFTFDGIEHLVLAYIG